MCDATANSAGQSKAHEQVNALRRRGTSWNWENVASSADREVVENGRTEKRHYGWKAKVILCDLDPFLLLWTAFAGTKVVSDEMGRAKIL